jgi:peptide methionine sulfoxide reductase MsrA
MHNPTTLNKQGNDKGMASSSFSLHSSFVAALTHVYWIAGTQYRSVIFYYNDEQKKDAEEVKIEVKGKWKDPIVTEISNASSLTFWAAEDYHQRHDGSPLSVPPNSPLTPNT